MPITYELVKVVSKELYARSLTHVPRDTVDALRSAKQRETSAVGQSTLLHILESAEAAAARNHYVCSDSGLPAYFVLIGTKVQLDGNIRQAFTDGQPLQTCVHLSSREAEVLQLIAEGLPNKQIASELCISIKTVEKHRQKVMNKLNIHDIAGLTRYAVNKGIVERGAPPPLAEVPFVLASTAA